MANSLRVAAVQMDATPGPVEARLARAGALAERAATSGAQLAVLPELFNTGFEFSDANYLAAEPADGTTSRWLRDTASRLGIHLAGSLLLSDRGEIFNTLLLYAPDGERWRYDKRYPAGWERAYFRGGRGSTIAQTRIGAMGLMICWDVAHRDRWRDHATKVDLMICASTTYLVSRATYTVPDGRALMLKDLGPAAALSGTEEVVFLSTVDEQAAWLGIPVIHSGSSGRLRSSIPTGVTSFLPFAPWLLRYRTIEIDCPMMNTCRVVDPTGKTIAIASEQGDAIAVAEVAIPDRRPTPSGPQPRIRVPRLAYVMVDGVIPAVSIRCYRRGLRRIAHRTEA